MSDFTIVISGSGDRPERSEAAAVACVSQLKRDGYTITAAAVSCADGNVAIIEGSPVAGRG